MEFVWRQYNLVKMSSGLQLANGSNIVYLYMGDEELLKLLVSLATRSWDSVEATGSLHN